MKNNEVNEHNLKCLSGYKNEQFDTLVIDLVDLSVNKSRDLDITAVTNLINLSHSYDFKIHLLLNPCFDTIAGEIVR